MGVDIYPHNGVVVASDVLFDALVSDENCADVCRLLLNHATIALADGVEFGTDVFVRSFASLRIDSTVEDLRSMFAAMTPAGDGDFGGYVENEEEGVSVWNLLIEELAPAAPRISHTLCITLPRYQGNWDLPRETVLLVFEEDACFTREKTDAGRQLDLLIGQETVVSEWTHYSY